MLAALSMVASRSRAEQSELLGERMPYAAFDALPKNQLKVGGAELAVAFAPGTFALPKEGPSGSRDSLRRWSASASP